MDESATCDPLATITEQFPGWETWAGIGGLLYARRLLTSPPAVFRGETAAELEAQIREYERTVRR